MAGTSTSSGSGFLVDRDNVLQIGKAFHEEAERMSARVAGYRQQMRTDPALGDPASADFRTGLNARLFGDTDSYLARADEYVTELRSAAEQCKAAAAAYGYSDGEISSVFGGTGGRDV